MESTTFRFPDPAGGDSDDHDYRPHVGGGEGEEGEAQTPSTEVLKLHDANGKPTSPSTISSHESSTTVNGNYTDGIISPVYWQHDRSSSISSHIEGSGGGITLEDHTETPSETSSALWARSVTITDHTLIQGNTAGTGGAASGIIGAYVVWNCRVETLDGGPIFIRKRYSEFDKLRQDLIVAFPRAANNNALPLLPPKSVFKRFQPKFLETRRAGLAYFLNCVMLNPEFAGSPIVKDFIFARHE